MKKTVSIIAAVLMGFVVSAKQITVNTDKYSVCYESKKEIYTDNIIDYVGDYSGDLVSAIKSYFTEFFADEYFRFVDVIEIKDGNYYPVMVYLMAKGHGVEFAEVAYNAIVSGNQVGAWAGNDGYSMMDEQFFLCRNKSDSHSHLFEGCVDSAKRFVVIVNQKS